MFTDDGPIDRAWDPTLVSRGAVLTGTTVVQGAEVTHRSVVAAYPRAGDTTVQLAAPATGWRPGDELVITGTDGATSDALRTITAVDGTTVTFDQPLERDRIATTATDPVLSTPDRTQGIVDHHQLVRLDRPDSECGFDLLVVRRGVGKML